MDDEVEREKEKWRRQAQQEEEKWRRQAEREKEKWRRLSQDPAQEREWIRQNNLVYGGLIVIGVYMVQPFLTVASLDTSAKVCVIAFSVAIPLLTALIMVNQQETFRQRASKSRVVGVTKVAAQTAAFVGVVAGFWHILWIAGVGVLVSGLVAVGVHSAGLVRLERDGWDEPQPTDEAE